MMGLKLLLVGLFWCVGWTLVTQDNNTAFQSEWATLTSSTWPTAGATWYGVTDFLGYFVDVLANVLGRVVAFFAGIVALFITPEITFYTQTIDLTGLGVVNLMMFGLFGFGIYGTIRGV